MPPFQRPDATVTTADSPRAAALKAELGDEVFAELLALFRAGARDDRRRIAAAIKAGDAADLREAAHKLKGAASSLGYEQIAAAAKALEFAEAADWPALKTALEKALQVLG